MFRLCEAFIKRLLSGTCNVDVEDREVTGLNHELPELFCSKCNMCNFVFARKTRNLLSGKLNEDCNVSNTWFRL